MGEYAHYQGESVKIGTCENMYYLRDDQRHLITGYDFESTLDRDRFRFPFPDEDDRTPGQYADYDRSIEIPGYMPENDYPIEEPAVGPIRVVQQGHREGELRTIVVDSSDRYGGQRFQLSKYEAMRAAIKLLEYSCQHEAPQYHDGGFYHELAKRMLAGYGVELDQLIAKQSTNDKEN